MMTLFRSAISCSHSYCFRSKHRSVFSRCWKGDSTWIRGLLKTNAGSVFHFRKGPVHWHDDAPWSNVNKISERLGDCEIRDFYFAASPKYWTHGHWNSTGRLLLSPLLHGRGAVHINTAHVGFVLRISHNRRPLFHMFTPSISQHIRNTRGTVWTGSWAWAIIQVKPWLISPDVSPSSTIMNQ